MKKKDKNTVKNSFSITAKVFLAAVAAARRAVVTKPVIPALENLRFDVRDGWLTLSASDTETSVKVRRELIASSYEGSFLILPTFAGDTLKGLSHQRLDFAVTDSRVEVTWDGGRITVAIADTEGWPEEEPVKGAAESAVVAADDMLQGLSLVDYAAAKDELRPVLCGVDMEFKGTTGGMEMVATDAHILAVAQVPHASSPRAFEAVVPRRTVALLKALMPAGHEVSVKKDDAHVVFTDEDEGITITGRLLEGKFPNWRSVIPKAFAVVADVQREALLAAAVRLGACAGPGHALEMGFSGNGVELYSRDLGMGVEGEETVSCTTEGDGIDICFRMDKLKAILDNMPGIRVRFYMNESGTAVVLRDAEEADTDGADRRGRGVTVSAMIMPVMAPSKEG